MTVYTLGYGGLAPSSMGPLLNEYGVKTVVDVRLRPDRAAMGAYVLAKDPSRGIQGLLTPHGIGYVSLVELGNPFLGCDDWAERYARLMDAAGEVMTERLAAVEAPYCLLCCEKRPETCHRAIIGRWLESRGHQVVHVVP